MEGEAKKRESPIAASGRAKTTLRRISKALKVRQIDLLDWAVDALDGYFDKHKGRVLLPLNFEEDFLIVSGRPESGLLEVPPKHVRSKRGS